jgi:hypothetical protein
MKLGHVVVRIGARPAPTFEEWFIKQFGHTRRVEIVTDSFNSLPQFIFGTQRIATVHERLAAFYASTLQLRMLPTPVDIPVLTEDLQWHQYLEGDAGHQWMLNLIRRCASAGFEGVPAPLP